MLSSRTGPTTTAGGFHTSAASNGAARASARAGRVPSHVPAGVRPAENKGADTVEDWLPSRYLPSPESKRRSGSVGSAGGDTTSEDEAGATLAGGVTPPAPGTAPWAAY